LPPLVVSIGREKDELRFELRQRDPRCVRAKAIESWFQWMASSRREFYGNPQPVDSIEEMGIIVTPR
jgi:hypothetical protein